MNKFIRRMCLPLSLVLCVNLAATSVFAAEPETGKGNSRMVTVTYKILVEEEDDIGDMILGTEQVEVEYGAKFIHEEELSNIPKGYKLLSSLGIRIHDHQTEVSAYLALDPNTPTEPEVTEPETIEPETTEPEVTEPETTEPETTKPDETVPETKPNETTPATKPNVEKDDVPKTGDESNLVLWTAVAYVYFYVYL